MKRTAALNFLYACLFSAFQEVLSHKLRSLLSITGVAIGVAAFATMMSIGRGFQAFTQRIVADAGGLDLLTISAKEPLDAKEAYGFAKSPGLRTSDLDSLRKYVKGVGEPIRYIPKFEVYLHVGRDSYRISVHGVNEAWLADYRMDAGRGFTPDEYEKGAAVCLVSSTLWEMIQDSYGRNPNRLIGQRLHITQGINPVAVGIIYKDMFVRDYGFHRNSVFVPFRYSEKYIFGNNPTHEFLTVRVDDAARMAGIKDDIARVLKGLHRGVEDFVLEEQDWLTQFSETLGNVRLAFLLITALALLVGGLNIMNMMLVSISTRLREIGLRHAVGATRFQIFLQFLVEAGVLSTLGGAAGMILSALPILALQGGITPELSELKPIFSASVAVVGLAVSVLEGVVFGLYPAIKAQRLNPLTALQYE